MTQITSATLHIFLHFTNVLNINLLGMLAIVKEDSCWLMGYSIMTGFNFFILLAGVISSVR